MSEATTIPPTAAPAPGQRSRLWPLWLMLRLLGWTGLALLALLAAIVCFALFPPSDLLRRAALPIARSALNHDNLELGSLELRPLSHVELRDLWLGPPRGYSRPMLTVGRIVVRYDLSRIAQGELRVVQVQVERPVLRVEHRRGKLNWLAFLENLPPSKEPEPEEPPAEPSDLTIVVDRVSVIGLGAHVDDGQHQIALDSLNLALWGVIRGATTRDLHATVQIQGREAGRPSVSFFKRGRPDAPALGALLATDLSLEVDLAQRPAPRTDLLRPNIKAALSLRLDAASRELVAPWSLDPVKLSLALDARADTVQDRAELQSLRLAFNDAELLRLGGEVKQLFADQRLDLLLARLHLPLDRLSPYARAVVKGIDFGGDVQVKDLRVTGAVKELASGSGLPGLDGTLALEQVWASVGPPAAPGLQARLEDLDVRLAFSNRRGARPLARDREVILRGLPALDLEPSPEALSRPDDAQIALPSVMLMGKISLGAVKVALGDGKKSPRTEARVERIELRLGAGATLAGTTPQGFGARLALRIPTIHIRDPKLGPIRLGLNAELAAGGDLARQELVLERLALDLPGLLGLRVSARAEALGQRGLSAEVELLPLKLANLIARAPPAIRAKLKGMRLAGSVGLKLKVKGKRPAVLPRSPLALPVELDARVTLDGVGLTDPGRQITLSGLSGSIGAAGRPTDLKVDTELKLAAARLTGQQTVVLGVTASDHIHLQRERILAHAAIGVASFGKSDQGLAGRGLSVSLEVDTALSLARMITGGAPVPGKTTIKARHALASLDLAQPGSRLAVRKVENGLDLSYAPSGAGAGEGTARVAHFSRVGSLRQQGAQVTALEVKNDLTLPVPLRQLITAGAGELDKIAGRLDLALGTARLTGSGPQIKAGPLTTRLDYSYQRSRARPVHVRHRTKLASLELGRAEAKVRGLSIDQRSEVAGVRLSLPKVVVDPSAATVALELEVASLLGKGLRPLRGTSVQLDAALSNGLNDLSLRKVRLRAPSNGLHLDLSGSARRLRAASATALPPFSLQLSAGVDNPAAERRQRATFLAPGVYGAGKAGVILRARSPDGRRLVLDGRLVADAFSLWQRSESIAEREPEGFLRTVRYLTFKHLSADLPISQRLTLDLTDPDRWALPPPQTSIFAKQAASTLYRALRPYTGRRSKLVIGGIELDERLAALNRDGHLINTARRRNKIDKLALDLALGDSTLLLERLYLKVFGGDIAGSVRAQLIDPKRPDVRLQLRIQVTGVNLAYLDPEATEHTDKTAVSALLDLQYELCRQHVEGRIIITQLSLDMLDSLLAYLDPNKLNESVQKNRKLLKSWYVKLANPRVKLISVWINHGNVNLDIEVTTLPGLNAIVNNALRNIRIRRLNIKPFLPACRAPASQDKGKEIE